jgi:hypothetical protein
VRVRVSSSGLDICRLVPGWAWWSMRGATTLPARAKVASSRICSRGRGVCAAETQSLAVMEAPAQGLPCVLSDYAAIESFNRPTGLGTRRGGRRRGLAAYPTCVRNRRPERHPRADMDRCRSRTHRRPSRCGRSLAKPLDSRAVPEPRTAKAEAATAVGAD